MSKFSNYLRKLIDQSGESIASISRNAGIERTSVSYTHLDVYKRQDV